MGSISVPQAELPPQQEFSCPDATRNAASPYFSFTTSLMLVVLILAPLLAADDGLRLNSLVTRTALGVEKAQQILKCIRIGRIPEERPLTAHAHQVFVLEFVEMMRQRARGNVQFAPNLAHHQALGMRAQ